MGIVSLMPNPSRDDDKARVIGRRLAATREALDLTQEELAELIGVSRSALSNWELGRLPDIEAMMRLGARRKIPLDWIYLGDDSQLPLSVARRLAENQAHPTSARRRAV